MPLVAPSGGSGMSFSSIAEFTDVDFTVSGELRNALVTLSGTGSMTMTLPTNASSNIDVGTVFYVYLSSFGITVFISTESGVTLQGISCLNSSTASNRLAKVVKVAANVWIVNNMQASSFCS